MYFLCQKYIKKKNEERVYDLLENIENDKALFIVDFIKNNLEYGISKNIQIKICVNKAIYNIFYFNYPILISKVSLFGIKESLYE